MGKYLDFFPKTLYRLDNNQYSTYDTVADITFRLNVIQSTLANFSSYYQYTVRDGDTPEILADRVYGDTQAHWIILYANNIYDPHYDWPLEYTSFHNYISKKYGSVENAQTTWHHFEKIVTRENQKDNVTTVFRYEINESGVATSLSPEIDALPYDTYNSLETGYSAVNIVDGKTVIETVSRNRVSNYDWEVEQNEKKRQIKIIKREYYGQILAEFDTLTKNVRNPALRRLV